MQSIRSYLKGQALQNSYHTYLIDARFCFPDDGGAGALILGGGGAGPLISCCCSLGSRFKSPVVDENVTSYNWSGLSVMNKHHD